MVLLVTCKFEGSLFSFSHRPDLTAEIDVRFIGENALMRTEKLDLGEKIHFFLDSRTYLFFK
jgi:hypothetical protein